MKGATDCESTLSQIGCGKGVLGQLSLETGLPQNVVELTLVAFIGYNAFSVSLTLRHWVLAALLWYSTVLICLFTTCMPWFYVLIISELGRHCDQAAQPSVSQTKKTSKRGRRDPTRTPRSQ